MINKPPSEPAESESIIISSFPDLGELVFLSSSVAPLSAPPPPSSSPPLSPPLSSSRSSSVTPPSSSAPPPPSPSSPPPSPSSPPPSPPPSPPSSSVAPPSAPRSSPDEEQTFRDLGKQVALYLERQRKKIPNRKLILSKEEREIHSQELLKQSTPSLQQPPSKEESRLPKDQTSEEERIEMKKILGAEKVESTLPPTQEPPSFFESLFTSLCTPTSSKPDKATVTKREEGPSKRPKAFETKPLGERGGSARASIT